MNCLALFNASRGPDKQLPDSETPAAEWLDMVTLRSLAVVGERDESCSLAEADHLVAHVHSSRKAFLTAAANRADRIIRPDSSHPSTRSSMRSQASRQGASLPYRASVRPWPTAYQECGPHAPRPAATLT
jgi:hypothetical protein